LNISRPHAHHGAPLVLLILVQLHGTPVDRVGFTQAGVTNCRDLEGEQVLVSIGSHVSLAFAQAAVGTNLECVEVGKELAVEASNDQDLVNSVLADTCSLSCSDWQLTHLVVGGVRNTDFGPLGCLDASKGEVDSFD
jgi:hypothetical protein